MVFWTHIYTRVLPAASLVVGCSALLFQTTVLYPWHHKLEEEFARIEKLQIGMAASIELLGKHGKQ